MPDPLRIMRFEESPVRERDISIVIPARQEHPQATFTLQVIWDILEDSGLDWETIIVDNMSNDKTATWAKKRWWEGRGGRGPERHTIIEYTEEGSCWQARNAGIQAAQGELIFLFDAHVVISQNLFARQIELFKSTPAAAVVYTPLVMMSDSKKHRAYGYKLGPDDDPIKQINNKFWGSWTRNKQSDDPYRIPMSGTAGIAIRKSYLDSLPGGGWPQGLSVYGGGEQYISLLTWMMGRECWIHPDTYMYHFADYRKYSNNGLEEGGKSTNDAHHFNKCLVAYALGGDEWWVKVLDMALKQWNPAYHDGAVRLAEEAKEKALGYREWIDANAMWTLNEVLEMQPWGAHAEVQVVR